MRKALLIEPEPLKGKEIADLLRDVLRGEQVVVEHAKDGPEALRKLLEPHKLDVILMDIGMPALGATDLLRKVRNASPATPVVVMTAYASETPEGAGPLVDFLTKPISFDKLRRAVERALRGGSGHIEGDPWGPNSPAAHVVRDLHEPGTGRLDAKRIADYLSLPLSALAAAIDVKPTTVHKTPASLAAQEKLAPIAWIIGVLFLLFRDRGHLLTWLNSPHPDLGKRTPMSFILEGKATAISEMLEATLAGQPS